MRTGRCERIADGALVIFDPEPLLDDALKVDAPPAHHAVDGGIRADFHDPGQFRLLRSRSSTAASDSNRRLWFASFVEPARRRSSDGVWLGLISTTLGMARVLHATLNHANLNLGIPPRVTSAGR